MKVLIFCLSVCSFANAFRFIVTKKLQQLQAVNEFDPRVKYGEKNLIPKRTAEYFGPINGALAGVDKKTNVYDALLKLGNFKTLTTAIKAAGLEGKMSNRLTTLFAPTDDAFSKLPAGNVEALLKDIPSLTNLILFHVHRKYKEHKL
jgi:uncharacterized surface protein with fasciclin (FAS1) repeats